MSAAAAYRRITRGRSVALYAFHITAFVCVPSIARTCARAAAIGMHAAEGAADCPAVRLYANLHKTYRLVVVCVNYVICVYAMRACLSRFRYYARARTYPMKSSNIRRWLLHAVKLSMRDIARYVVMHKEALHYARMSISATARVVPQSVRLFTSFHKRED